MAILNVLRGMSGSTQVPMGTPISPAISMGASRRQSTARQMVGSVVRWPSTEHADASWAAISGSTACSHMGSPVSAVPNPVRPLTKPPASAPARMRASVAQSPTCDMPRPVPGPFLEVAPFNTICWL